MAQHFELPNPHNDTVFYITSSININCPPSHAYHVLRDFSTWPAWNSFCPKANVKSSTVQDKQAKLLVPGMKLTLHVKMDPKSPALRAQTEEVTEASDANAEGVLRVSWSQATMPQFLLRSLRVNELQAGNDAASCQYRTWITMAGPTAYIVKRMFESTLQARFDDWSVDLKRYAEETWQKQVQSN